MITPKYNLVLFEDINEFMDIFWFNAHEHLQLHQTGQVPEDYYRQVRESPIDGVRYLVWARIMPSIFPAVEVRYNEVEERDITKHPEEKCHRAG